MKDYAALIPTAMAEDVRWLVWEAADDREISSARFAEIANIARKRLKELESVESSDPRIHPAGTGGDRPVCPTSPVKKLRGWPKCERCDLWLPLFQACNGVNSQGKAPCEVMSRKAYKYQKRDD